MRILFVYPNISRTYHPQLGLASLSGVARSLGHERSLFDLIDVAAGDEVRAFGARLAEYDPDLVAVSCRSSEATMARALLGEARRRRVTTVVGGPHCTVCPAEMMDIADFEIAGEGEVAFADLLSCLKHGRKFARVPNLVWRNGGGIVRNELGPLIENLDALPIPEWSVFSRSHFEQSFVRGIKPGTRIVGAFEGSRGCPYRCTYCTNEFTQRLYAGRGRWRREKSPARIVSEIEAFRSQYGLDLVYWVDEVFLTRVERLRQLSAEYARHIGRPFIFMDRPELITSEKAELAQAAGAYSVSLGIETGDPELRRKLLQRSYDDRRVVEAFAMMRRAGIKTHAFVMIGVPGETPRTILSTYDILMKIKPDTAQFSIFYPLRGTRLRELCVEAGYVDADAPMPADYYAASVLRLPTLSAEAIGRYQKLLEVLAMRPARWKRALLVAFAKVPPLLFGVFYPWRLMSRFWEAMRRLGPRMFFQRLRVHVSRRLASTTAST